MTDPRSPDRANPRANSEHGRAEDRPDETPGDRRRIPSGRELSLRAELIQVRHELKTLLDELARCTTEETEKPVQSAVVTSVVARTALIPQRRSR
jgi:hypothetical protein